MKLKNTSNSQTHVNSFIFSTKTFLKYIHYVLKCFLNYKQYATDKDPLKKLEGLLSNYVVFDGALF